MADPVKLEKVARGSGFIAALDQSGGSTPKALKLYGVPETAYSGEAQMFDLVHQMRSRIVTSPAFDGKRVLGAILFEMTMDRQVEGMDFAEYWLSASALTITSAPSLRQASSPAMKALASP